MPFSHKKKLLLFILIYALIWILLPTALFPNPPLDVNEGFMWGQTLQWGYYKHPPLQAWLLELTYRIFHANPFGYFLLAQLTILIGILGVYYTALRITDKTRALLAAISLTTIYYFNITSLEFNPNTLQIATWSWVGYFFIKALQDNYWQDWIGLGIFLAACAFTKYFSIFLGLSLLLFFLFDTQARTHLRTLKPYTALIICILLLVPQLLWLLEHDFLPFSYAIGRGTGIEHSFFSNHFLSPLNFLLAQFSALLFITLGLYLLYFKQSAIKFTPLFTLAWLPLLLTLVIGITTGMRLRTMWGTPLLSFIPVYLLHYHIPTLQNESIKRFIRLILVVNVLFIVLLIGAQWSGKAFSRMNFAGNQLAQAWQNVWPQQAPPYAIIGSHWLAGNASLHSKQRPLVFIDADLKKSPWIDIEQIRRQGAIVISETKNIAKDLQTNYQLETQWQSPIIIQNQTYQLGIIQGK